MEEKNEKLMAKCEEMKEDPNLIKECQILLETMSEKNVEMEDESGQSYTGMITDISPEDVPKVLEMALKIARSTEIKDNDLKRVAERIIRTLEPVEE
ncbi:MAG: hypothetical protein ABSE83_05970 [Methanobacterium sp.]|jgi:hypothetical protein